MPAPARTRRTWLLAGVLFVTLPVALAAHLKLLRSEPAAGATLRVPPAHVQLWFTEAPLLPFSRVALTGPAGAVSLGGLREGAERSVVADVPTRLAPGQYRLTWRTAGDDGHAVDGSVEFGVAKPAPPQP